VENKVESLLMQLASKYIWWKPPAEAVTTPERVMAQVMNIGDYTDVQLLANQVGDDALRSVIAHAEAGQFNERSWAYWHYRLGLAALEQVPPLPVRRFALALHFLRIWKFYPWRSASFGRNCKARLGWVLYCMGALRLRCGSGTGNQLISTFFARHHLITTRFVRHCRFWRVPLSCKTKKML
jgi:hypothetical protein